MSSQPNILWIMADQHRADCLGCMGHDLVRTPNLDQLAANSLLFENAFCQSPACMSSRACLFTGRYPEVLRVRGMGILPPAETTFPEVLQRNGYRTGAFGKVHLTPELYTRETLGSDVPILDWRQFVADAKLAPIPDDPCKRDYGFQEHVGCDDKNQGNFRKWLAENKPNLADAQPERAVPELPDLYVSPYPSEFHQTTYIAGQACDFIKHQQPGQPWFAFCSFVAPHHPFEASADQIARYDLSDISLPRAEEIDPELIPMPARNAIGEMSKLPEDVQRKVIQHYLASISLVDDGVGRLLETLADTGQEQDTLVIFVADHGEFLGNHGLLRKPSIHFDDTLRVPLILRVPWYDQAQGRVKGLVELADVHPTLLGLLGLQINAGVQGIDWSEAISVGESFGRENIYCDMYDMPHGPYLAVYTLRTESWKLNIYPTAGKQFGQLFDLANDPGETRNLYAEPAYRDQREDLLWRLLQRIHANTDPLPIMLSQW